MLEHHQTPTDAIPPNPGSVPNENFSLTSLVQPPQQGEKFPMSRDTSTPTPATFSKYLTDMTIHDTDLNRAVDGYFAKADTDQNGYVDRNEVENSKDNKDLTPKESIIRSMLDASLPSIQNQNNDEWGGEDNGASRSDVTTAFDKWMKHNQTNVDLANLSSYLPPIFDSLDADGNGFLTEKELDSPYTPGADFEERFKQGWAAETLARDFANVQKSTDDGLNESKGISIGDVFAYAKPEQPGSGNEYMSILDGIYWPKGGKPAKR